jgi:hypothetical protein
MFGLAEVTGTPQKRQVRPWQEERWPWYMTTRTRLVVPNLSSGPSLADAGLPWPSIRAYVELAEDQFEACQRELKRVGRSFTEP